MKKTIIIFSLAILFISLIPPKKSHAAAPVLARVVAGTQGEKIVIGIAEKAGVKVTTKEARQKAVERWNLEMYEKKKYYEKLGKEWEAEELARFQNQIANVQKADVIPFENRPGYSKFILSTAGFLIGADIAYDIYSEMKLASAQERMMETMGDYEEGLRTGEYAINYGNIFSWRNDEPIGKNYESAKTRRLYYKNPTTGEYENTHYFTSLVYMAMPNYNYFYQENGKLYAKVDFYYYTDHSHDVSIREIGSKYLNLIDKTQPLIKQTPVAHGTVDLAPHFNTLLDPMRKDQPTTNNEGLPSIDSPQEIPTHWPSEIEIAIPDGGLEVTEPWNDPFQEPKKDTPGDPGTDPDGDTDPGKDPDGDTDPGKDPDGDTDPGKDPDGDTDPGKDPDGDTDPGGEPNPEDPPPGGEGDDIPNRDPSDDQNRFSALVTNKFPFSLPWDIKDVVSALVASPQRPTFDLNLDKTIAGKNFKFSINHDFKWMDSWIIFVRTFIILSFIIFLIASTRKLLGGAQ